MRYFSFSIVVFLFFFVIVSFSWAQSWSPAWEVSGTSGNVENDWIQDGINGRASYTSQGLELDTTSGTGNDHSSILWSKQAFQGDIKLEYEFKRVDQNTNLDDNVSIVLLQGHGIGGDYPDDISTWERPVSGVGFHQTMNHHTISYATNNREIRTRINTGRNLVEPVYQNIPYFEPGVWHKIIVTLQGNSLSMNVRSMQDNTNDTYSWNLPRSYDHGRIGLRQMYMRKNLYKNIKVSVLGDSATIPTSEPENTACTINVSNNSQLSSANSSARAGSVICVSAGNYSTAINPSNSGSAGNPIMYKAQGVVTISGSGTLANITKNYIVVDGFTFKNNGSTKNGHNAELKGSNIIFKNNNIELTGPSYNKTDARVAVMYRYANGHRLGGISIQGNNNTVEGNKVENFNFGMRVTVGGGKKSVIKNNTVLNSGQSSIVIGHTSGQIRGLLVEGNTFDGSWIEDGIQFAPDYSSSASKLIVQNFGTIIRGNIFKNMGENSLDFKSVRYVVVEGNVFYGTIGSNNGGMEGYDQHQEACNQSGNKGTVRSELPVYSNRNQTGGTPCWVTSGGVKTFGRGSKTKSDHLITRNNVVYGNAGGLTSKGARYKFYNNTILGNNTDFKSTNSGNKNGFYYNGESGVVFKNNIIGGHNGGDVASGSGFGNLSLSNNLYWGSTPVSQDISTQTGDPKLSGINTNKPSGDNHTFAQFALTQNSTNAIDKGTFIAKITANSSSNKIKVDDPYLFTDGYGIVAGDKIMIKSGNNTTEATITAINYDGKELTLNKSVNVSTNDKVNLSYTGSAPDIGAIEYGQEINITPAPTSGESTPTPLPTESTPPPVEGNLIINGDFSDGTNNWSTASTNSGSTNLSVNSSGEGVVDVSNGGGDSFNQLYQTGISIVEGREYILRFKAKSNTDGKSMVVTLKNPLNSANLIGIDGMPSNITVTLTQDMTEYSQVFTAVATETDARFRIVFNDEDVYTLDDFILEEYTEDDSCPLFPQGDATCDGVVDSADYSCWKTQFITVLNGGTPSATNDCRVSDFNEDNTVNLLDFVLWKGNKE